MFAPISHLLLKTQNKLLPFLSQPIQSRKLLGSKARTITILPPWYCRSRIMTMLR
ncbi:hypothetical protein RchiOBHm_Chr6g0283771 [Rosa chinensis]|uniref:Uncharacterized protein n=1 Tax=Rosa chinensis TaxID=74649 RepID=A0A2P6PU77_ROSCH|nr:hypothetical protein RchiOBHm_Chr6g0283771 [Rosa chinensis]